MRPRPAIGMRVCDCGTSWFGHTPVNAINRDEHWSWLTLIGVSPLDPIALIGAALVVTGVAFAAGTLPARRAAGVDPGRTLHCE